MRRYLNRYKKIKSCFCSYRRFFFLWTFKTNVSLPESSSFWPLTEGVTVWGAGSALPTRVLKKKIKENLEHNPVYPVFFRNQIFVKMGNMILCVKNFANETFLSKANDTRQLFTKNNHFCVSNFCDLPMTSKS